MRWRLAMLAVPLLVVTGLLGAPAQAATGQTGYAGCIQTSGSDTLWTYVTADITSYPVSNTQERVLINTDAAGRTYDCGTGGRPHNAPRIDVRVTYYVSGSSINCGVGINLGGDASISCSLDRRSETVSDPFSCANASRCTISHRQVPFVAAPGGRIDRIDASISAMISGPNDAATAYSFVTVFRR
jgi:hypothetical protein